MCPFYRDLNLRIIDLDASREVGAQFVELHTGPYAIASGEEQTRQLERLRGAVEHALSIGLRVNAGHGLDYQNTPPVAAIDSLEELNIGFAIVARSVFDGVDRAVGDMARMVRGESS